MITMVPRTAHHQALMMKTAQMSLTVTYQPAASRESRIHSNGGTRTKLAILVCHGWPKIILQSLVSILSAFFL